MKITAILFLLAPLRCLAQQFPDTVMLPQVAINADRNQVFTSGSQTTLSDTVEGNPFRATNIAELLEQKTAVFVKSNGAGGLATITSRGTEARHNAVLWHGFNLNSASLGVADLSIVPALASDEISLLHGGSSAVNGNSAIGSVLLLENTSASFNHANRTAINLEGGSFGNYHGIIKSEWNNTVINSKTTVFYDVAENDYPFRNIAKPGHPEEEQKHAGFSNYGLIQDFAFRINTRQVIEAGVWYQVTNREIPSLMMVPESYASQSDSNLRIHGSYSLELKNSIVNVKGAFFDDHQEYDDEKFDLHKRYDVKNYFGEASWNYNAGKKLAGSLGLAYNEAVADFKEYQGSRSRAVASVFGSVKYRFFHGWYTGMNIRQEFSNITNPPVTPYLTLDGNLFRDRLFLSVQAGRHFSLPSMNDLYWVPGGNPELKPEYGWTESVSLVYKNNNKLPEVTVTAFNAKIDNWIKWQPGASGMSAAENLEEVHARGAEILLRYRLAYRKFSGSLNSSYSYTRSGLSEKSAGESAAAYNKQLIYVPEHMWNGNLSLGYTSWSLHYTMTYTGKRYTTADNAHFLEGYSFADIAVEKKFNSFKIPFGVYVRISNLYDASYQVLAWQPAPGRGVSAGIRADLIFKTKNHNKTN